MQRKDYRGWIGFIGGMLLVSCQVVAVPPSPTISPWIDPSITFEPAPVSFSLERIGDSCSRAGAAIPLRLVFQNFTDRIVRIRNDFSPHLPNGNLTPIIADGNGIVIRDSRQYMIVDSFPPPPTPLFRELLPHDSFEISVDYSFPSLILPKDSGPSITPASGLYTVKFQYLSYGSGDDGIWNGVVESNTVELCVD